MFYLLVLQLSHIFISSDVETAFLSVPGQRLYVTMFPCNECAKVIIQVYLAEVKGYEYL